jgi:hypothetical protein
MQGKPGDGRLIIQAAVFFIYGENKNVMKGNSLSDIYY